MLDFIDRHFETMALLLIFFGAGIMLAAFPMREEMSRWFEGGPVIAAIVALIKARKDKGKD